MPESHRWIKTRVWPSQVQGASHFLATPLISSENTGFFSEENARNFRISSGIRKECPKSEMRPQVQKKSKPVLATAERLLRESGLSMNRDVEDRVLFAAEAIFKRTDEGRSFSSGR
jgi:hypothetical protein